MLDNKNTVELIDQILDEPGDEISTDSLKSLIDNLTESEVICPVKDNEILLYEWGLRKFIPASCNMDDFNGVFSDESYEIFKFTDLKNFQNEEVDGIIINPGSRAFIMNNMLCELVFNGNRETKSVSGGYDVKVRLNNFRPLTWRDLIIPDNITFMELDDILKTLWGFNGYHLSCFLIRDNNSVIMDGDLANDTMMGCDYEANTTLVSEIFDKYNKITYWYDFGDDWKFDIEIKKKVDYDKDYVFIKRFKGKYDPIEDCGGVCGLSDIIYLKEHPDVESSQYYRSDWVEYLEEFDIEYSQLLLETKSYVKSSWHGG